TAGSRHLARRAGAQGAGDARGTQRAHRRFARDAHPPQARRRGRRDRHRVGHRLSLRSGRPGGAHVKIAGRLSVAAVLCALVGFLAAPLVPRVVSRRDAVGHIEEPMVAYLYRTYERARCEAAPRTWSMPMDHSARTYAYDAETLVSLNPEAPPLDR